MKTAYRNLQEFVTALERAGELMRISARCRPSGNYSHHRSASKSPGGGQALLFEPWNDLPSGVDNAFGSERRICMAMGVPDLDTLAVRVRRFIEMDPPKSLGDAFGWHLWH